MQEIQEGGTFGSQHQTKGTFSVIIDQTSGDFGDFLCEAA